MIDDTTPRPPENDPHRSHRLPLPAGAPVRIGRHETLRALGHGQFGRVYLARDPEMDRYVAIKMPNDPLPADSHRAFLREARAVADIHHPNVCPVYDVGVQDELPFIVMRYVRGGALGDALDRGLVAPAADVVRTAAAAALRIAAQIARGLDAAHARRVIHRDLKPANVLYDPSPSDPSDVSAGQLLLTDFGIARWLDHATTTTGGTPGTPAYMAPEQWEPDGRFGPISPRTDVYSLGVVLFRLLTDVPLFAGNTYHLMCQHCDAEPFRPSAVRPELDARLDALCLKALAKQPADRYDSAGAFADAIEDYFERETGANWRFSWYSRPAGAATREWQLVARTRTIDEIAFQPWYEYRLVVNHLVRGSYLADLARLEGAAALRELDAGDGRADADLAHLRTLTGLRRLRIGAGGSVTDAGLTHLRALTGLTTLDLTDCTQLTPAALDALRTALPKCKLLR